MNSNSCDAKLAHWRKCLETVEEKRKAYATCPTSGMFSKIKIPDDLRSAQAEVALLEAQADLETARHDLVTSLDALELAEGDPLAVARDPGLLARDVSAFDAEVEEAKAKIASLNDARNERIRASFAADVEHAKRRTASSQPTSAATPRASALSLDGRGLTFVDVLRARHEAGEPRASFAERIAAAKDRVVHVAGTLEMYRRDEEAREKAKVAAQRAKDAAIESMQRSEHRREREVNAARDAEARERREAGEAFLRRQSQGGG